MRAPRCLAVCVASLALAPPVVGAQTTDAAPGAEGVAPSDLSPPAPPAGPPPDAEVYVPPGYGEATVSAPPPPPVPALPPPVTVQPQSGREAERARKQALRDRMRLTVGGGLGYTSVSAGGLSAANDGWAVTVSIGGRYHFTRFASFQTRVTGLGGAYLDDPAYGVVTHGPQLGLLGQATLRFVTYPFYLGAGATVGLVTRVHVGTQLSAGLVGEIGLVFGRDEQIDVGMQVVQTPGVFVMAAQMAWSFGGHRRGPPPRTVRLDG